MICGNQDARRVSIATIPDDDNRSRMVDVPVSVGLTYPELELRRIA